MYTIEGVIQRAVGRKRLKILLLHELFDGYIENLALLPHDFYIITDFHTGPQWVSETTPANLHVSKGLGETCVKNFDLIICFGRGNICDKAEELSALWHVPIVIVDIVGAAVLSPSPFFSQIHIDHERILFERNAIASVAVDDSIKESWVSSGTPITVTIEHVINTFDVNPEATKILIDPYLPKAYIDSLPIDINNTIFTTNVAEAAIYLHLWQSTTPKMLNCIKSKLPVVTFKSDDMLDLLEKNLCITIEDLRDISPTFIQELKGFEKIEHVMEQVDMYQSSSIAEFINRWENIIDYTRHSFYIK